MKDYRRYDLRQLTESIFYIRERILKFKNSSTKEYIDIKEQYEKLWKQRDELEDEVFGKEK
jgi:hypothetical protein